MAMICDRVTPLISPAMYAELVYPRKFNVVYVVAKNVTPRPIGSAAETTQPAAEAVAIMLENERTPPESNCIRA